MHTQTEIAGPPSSRRVRPGLERATLVAILGVILVACSASPEPSPAQRASPESSAGTPSLSAVTPSPTVAPATPTPTAEPRAAPRNVGPDMVAVVVTDNLVIKSEPGTGKESVGYKPWLQRGDQLYVLRGPVRASGYKWYEVMPLSDKYFPDWFYFSGWVAAASKKDKLWIKPLAGAPDCPDTPSTVAGLDRLSAGARLACFGGVPITVTALLATCSVEMADAGHDPPMFDGVYDPEADAPSPIELFDPQPDPCSRERGAIGLNVDPTSTSADALRVGDVVSVTGIFDHPAAADCVWYSFIQGGPDPDPEWCRPQFVVTRIE